MKIPGQPNEKAMLVLHDLKKLVMNHGI